jgi:hypothetical protein
VELADPAWPLTGGLNVRLPTPTLVGLPEDEAAYRALYRGYAKNVVARLISEQTNLSQTGQPLLGLALVERILQQLGLQDQPSSLAEVNYDGEAAMALLELLWHSETPLTEQLQRTDRRMIATVVAFLATNWSDEVPEAEMIRLMVQSSRPEEWLQRLSPSSSTTAFLDAWQSFQAPGHQAAAAQSWPEEVVLFMCDQGVIGSASLYRYDPAAAVMAKVLSGREFIRMEALPGGDGVLLTEQLISEAGQQSYIWRDGQLAPYEAGSDQTKISGEAIPDRRTGVLARTAQQNNLEALSSDGRWLAELGDGTLILSSIIEGFREEVAHNGRECRAVAWVQA